jgi:cardiolipin synthase
MLLGLINAARQELVLTTPYLVPDDAMIVALRGAASRGVAVTIILPEKVDSFLTRYASRSYYDDLLDAGVSIQLYRGGLLHTKSISVDGTMSMFGTVNLDMRSLWLNYEVALFVYQPEFTRALRGLQEGYIAQSVRLDTARWGARPFRERLLENTLRLLSPLL